MADETPEKPINQQILDQCQDRFDALAILSSRKDELTALLTDLLENDNLLETLADTLSERQEVWHEHIDDEKLGKILRGHIFEAVALKSLKQESRPYPELERFLLWSLKDPRLWYVDWEHDGIGESLSKEERKHLTTYTHVRPDKDELYALQNNDAIVVELRTDETTNKQVAVITGVVEAKNHQLTAGSPDEKQMKATPEILHDMVMRYKRAFPLLVKGLGFDADMPDAIDILEPDKLTYTIIQPMDLDTPSARASVPPAFKHCQFAYAPVTRDEVFAVGEVLRDFIKM